MAPNIRHTIPHKAKLLFHRKIVFPDRAIVEMKAWAVPRGHDKPEGLKYSLVYIDADGRRKLGFDNAEGKGHHRHDGAVETPCEFNGIDDLVRRFNAEVNRLRELPS